MNLSERDRKVIWHPYTQMQTAKAALGITRGEGVWLYDEAGNRYIDAIASWWTNLHGHAHPYLAAQIALQAGQLEHLIFAGFTHLPAVRLAELLLPLLPAGQKRVFYSDNGSTAVEVALKMACQYWNNQGLPRTRFIALREAYHGDTFGAMAVSGKSAFNEAFEPLLFQVDYVEAPLPGREHESIAQLKKILELSNDAIAAFIYEPVIQGTAGMRVMTPSALSEMIRCCQQAGVLCIADEVMTGFGRTGKMFASEYLSPDPDIVCLSKGLTGGMMALGVTTSTEKIFQAFLSDDRMKTLFHGHSYTANPIACSAGIASLELFEKEKTLDKIRVINRQHEAFVKTMKTHPGVSKIYCLGVILVIEGKTKETTGYFNTLSNDALTYFMERNVIIRPLGNVIYLMPPYCISQSDLEYIYGVIRQYFDSRL
jgi:adenosylmethionine-8-amino-7-oxononanoate aminotransferase